MKSSLRFGVLGLLASLGLATRTPAQVDPPYPHLVNVYLAATVDTTIIRALAKWDVVVLLSPVWTPSQLDELRGHNPNIKIFFYFVPYTVPLSPSTPWDEANLAYAEQNDLWWYNADGNVASDWAGTAMANITDLASAGPEGTWRDRFVDRLVDRVRDCPQLDGVFLDNFWRQFSWRQNALRLDSDCNPTHNPVGCNGAMDSHAVLDSLWHGALEQIASTIRTRFDQLQAPRPLAILSNGSDSYFQWLNGTLFEAFPTSDGREDVGNPYGYAWNQQMFECPGGYLVAPTPFNPVPYLLSILNSKYWGSMWTPARDLNFERHKRFTLASSLLGAGYYSLDSGPGGNQNLWWEPEYDHAGRGKGYLGQPLGPAQRLLAAPGAEILGNSDFSAGTATWSGYPFGAVGDLDIDAATYISAPYAARIDVGSVQPAGFYKLWQWPIQLTESVLYTLSFWGRATPGQTLLVSLYAEDCPSGYCWRGRRLCLSEDWTRFEMSFSSTGSAEAGLDFFVQGPGTVWLDDVSLRVGDTSMFRRDFQHGIVLLNYTSEQKVVDLEATYYRLHIPNSRVFDGTAVGQEIVPPYDSRILLRLPPAPLPIPPTDTPAHLAVPQFLGHNVPNPFNPLTEIRFRLASDEKVHLAIYDVAGGLVRVMVDRKLSGNLDHIVSWDGRDASGRSMPSGVYLYRITTPSFSQARKMVLSR